VLIVNPSVPAKDARELLAYVKQNPGKINFGTFGPGSTPHLYMEMLHHMAGLKFVPVQYRGAAPMLSDVVANHIPMTFISLGQALPLHQEGKVKIVAVCTGQRLDVLPDVPTLSESGVAGFEATAWHGLFAKAGTPPAILARINAELQRMAADPEFRAKVMEPTYFRSMVTPTAEFEATIKAETAKWKTFVEAAGVRIE
jgi:tripartite-type tricarboxylate transporter receptor subunit TctC